MAFDLKIKANSVSYRMLSSFQATTTRTTTIIVKHSNKLLLIFSSLYCLKQPQTSLLIFDFEFKKTTILSLYLRTSKLCMVALLPVAAAVPPYINFSISFSQLLIPYTLLFPIPVTYASLPSPTSQFTFFLHVLSFWGKGKRKGAGRRNWRLWLNTCKNSFARTCIESCWWRWWGRINSLSVAAGAFCSSCSREASWQDYKYKIKSRTLMNILFLVGGRQEGVRTSFLRES